MFLRAAASPGDWTAHFEQRLLDHIGTLGRSNPAADRAIAAVVRFSDTNLSLYRSFLNSPCSVPSPPSRWLSYRRNNRKLHLRSYMEGGAITTSFDIRVQNDIDRFYLVRYVVDHPPDLGAKGAYLKQMVQDRLIEHKHYIDNCGQNLPKIGN